MPIMHQHVSADERHFNHHGEEGEMPRKKYVKRGNKENNITAALFSLSVLCCPSEELEEIACDCSAQWRRQTAEKKEVRDIRVMQISEVSYILPQSFNFIL